MKPISIDVRHIPFAHASAVGFLDSDLAGAALDWMACDAPWILRIADFYEQWELHLDQENLPDSLKELVSPVFVDRLRRHLLEPITNIDLELAEVTAHKLVSGQTIRIHNDYIENAESHRVLIQLNRGWGDEQGGLLMLFGSGSANDLERIIRPLHRSAFGFTISDRSFHAVSTITHGERYTLVYSFRHAALVSA
ncbi:cyclophane-containing peptide 2OG-Fe(II) oxygenase YhhC [Novacetimonas pomaceti]|uniref:cyclophane-containing peptide 2OG-Fe(II) oxygenase YhhC n=1 Tax=Novacetimonas pomaceti TaxID=2021998 RepID=UPI001057816F|nr:cyclophane-containing peptide 2OG-Fe(II) oxygenase YhhC [Novacetimonas pomaceti]